MQLFISLSKFISVKLSKDELEVIKDLKKIKLKGKSFEFMQMQSPFERRFAVDYEGLEIGRAELNKRGFLDNIRIDPKFRRIGIASSIYRYIEGITNKKIIPSPIKQSKAIKNYWDSI
jgi:hypothetical protein